MCRLLKLCDFIGYFCQAFSHTFSSGIYLCLAAARNVHVNLKEFRIDIRFGISDNKEPSSRCSKTCFISLYLYINYYFCCILHSCAFVLFRAYACVTRPALIGLGAADVQVTHSPIQILRCAALRSAIAIFSGGGSSSSGSNNNAARDLTATQAAASPKGPKARWLRQRRQRRACAVSADVWASVVAVVVLAISCLPVCRLQAAGCKPQLQLSCAFALALL